MNRLAVGILITIAVLAMHALSGGPSRAAEEAALPSGRPAEPEPETPRSRRVLALILALEALRAGPEGPDRAKV